MHALGFHPKSNPYDWAGRIDVDLGPVHPACLVVVTAADLNAAIARNAPLNLETQSQAEIAILPVCCQPYVIVLLVALGIGQNCAVVNLPYVAADSLSLGVALIVQPLRVLPSNSGTNPESAAQTMPVVVESRQNTTVHRLRRFMAYLRRVRLLWLSSPICNP